MHKTIMVLDDARSHAGRTSSHHRLTVLDPEQTPTPAPFAGRTRPALADPSNTACQDLAHLLRRSQATVLLPLPTVLLGRCGY